MLQHDVMVLQCSVLTMIMCMLTMVCPLRLEPGRACGRRWRRGVRATSWPPPRARPSCSFAARRDRHRGRVDKEGRCLEPRGSGLRSDRPRRPAPVLRPRHGGRVRGRPDPCPHSRGYGDRQGRRQAPRPQTQAHRLAGKAPRAVAPHGAPTPPARYPNSSGLLVRRCTALFSDQSHSGPWLGASKSLQS